MVPTTMPEKWRSRLVQPRILQPWPPCARTIKIASTSRRGTIRAQFGSPITPVRFSGCDVLVLEMWRLVGGQPTCIKVERPLRDPNEERGGWVFRVSAGNPPKAREWRSDDVSGAPERIPIMKNPYSNRYRPQVLIQDGSSK